MDVQHMQWAIVHPGHLLPPLPLFRLLTIVLICTVLVGVAHFSSLLGKPVQNPIFHFQNYQLYL